MNIEDKSGPEKIVSWTNTVSREFNSTTRSNGSEVHALYTDEFGRSSYYDPYAWSATLLGDYMSLKDYEFINITRDTPVAQSASRITTPVQPGTYSWPFWMFWTLAGTLTFGSIIFHYWLRMCTALLHASRAGEGGPFA